MDNKPDVPDSKSPLSSLLTSPRFVKYLQSSIGRTAADAYARTKQLLNTPIPSSPFIQSLAREVRLKSPDVFKHDLKDVVERTNEVLASAVTVFPLTLFPDSIILDRTKLTITRRNFFFSSDVMSIRIEDILNVSAAVGPFFGALTIATRVMSSDDHFRIRNFTRGDAIHMKHMIQGYVIARHNNIPCEHLSRDELVKTLTELGRDTNRE